MVNFLEKIINVLSVTQKQAIKALVAEKTITGELLSLRAKQEESEQIYSRIKSKIGSILLEPKYAVPGEKISSNNYNEDMEAIYLDLTALYENIDLLSSVIQKQSITLNSDYLKSRAAIEKILNDVKVFSLRKQYPQFNEVKVIDFNSSNNQAKRGAIAEVDVDTRLLKLKPAIVQRKHLVDRASKHTKIYSKTYGKGLKDDLGLLFPLENLVDQKEDTFWGTILLADAPVSQVYEKPTTSGSSYQVDVSGPVTEIYFRFSHVEKINTIKLCPFSEFPIRVLDIAYRPSLSTQIFTQIEDFTPVVTSDWEEFNFSSVHAVEIRISITQENYKKLSYVLPKSIINNTDIFQHILKQRVNRIIDSEIANSDLTLYTIGNVSKYQETLDLLKDIYTNSEADTVSQPNLVYTETINNVLDKVYSSLSQIDYVEKINNLRNSEVLQQPDKTEVATIFKYEYFIGLREVFIGYNIYYPRCVYESEKYLTEATVSEVQIQVEELHPEFDTEWQPDYRKTSTTWEIDIGNNKTLPIHPINFINENNGYPEAKDELISFDLSTNKAYTRLGSRFANPHRLKKNGIVIPENIYSSIRTSGQIPRLEITLSGNWLDSTSIYSVDYYVAPTSYNISILDNFYSEDISFPEIFTEVGTDNDITLQKFPFINYEIVNSTGFFTKQNQNSVWDLNTQATEISSGQVRIRPTIYDSIGNILQLGSVSGQILSGEWGERSGQAPADLSGEINYNYFGSINGVSLGYFLKVMDNNIFAELDSVSSGSSFVLKEPVEVTLDQCRSWDAVESGKVFIGDLSAASGEVYVDYAIGVGVKTDNRVYALSNSRYEPIEVYVDNTLAANITNYVTREHPSFTITKQSDFYYQYLHDGNKLYFNQKIKDKTIRVYYRWITEYIKINATLNCHEPINPSLTPKINSIQIFMNNLVI